MDFKNHIRVGTQQDTLGLVSNTAWIHLKVLVVIYTCLEAWWLCTHVWRPGGYVVGQALPLCLLSWLGDKPTCIPRFVLLQWGLQSNRIAAFKRVHYHPNSG